MLCENNKSYLVPDHVEWGIIYDTDGNAYETRTEIFNKTKTKNIMIRNIPFGYDAIIEMSKEYKEALKSRKDLYIDNKNGLNVPTVHLIKNKY